MLVHSVRVIRMVRERGLGLSLCGRKSRVQASIWVLICRKLTLGISNRLVHEGHHISGKSKSVVISMRRVGLAIVIFIGLTYLFI